MGSPLDSSQFVKLLDTRLREVAEAKYRDLPGMIPTLFRVINSDSAWEEFYSVGAVPDIPQFLGALTYLGVAPGYHVKIEPNEYAAGIQLERKLLDDKKYAVLDNRAAGLGEAAKRTQEKSAVRAFANATSSSFDFMYNEEGQALASDTHLTKSGTSTASGFDNLGSTTCSKAALAATWILMRKFRNDISERIDMSDNYAIICPDDLGDTVEEAVGTRMGYSAYSTAGGHSNINADYGRYKIIRYLRWSDTSTSNWCMVNLDLMKNDLVWLSRIAPEFKTTVDFETYLVKHAVYMRYAYGWLDWRWMYFHNA